MNHEPLAAQLARACCADFYQSEAARLMLGDSFHPGGLRLTRRLADALALKPGERVLDVASGRGVSALCLARERGCSVVGLDYGRQSVAAAQQEAREAELSGRARFAVGDAEALPLATGAFDVVLCECALSTFSDQAAALSEMHRVLKPQGKLGLTDVAVKAPLAEELAGVAVQVACISGALASEGYSARVEEAGFTGVALEDDSWAVADLVRDLRHKVSLARMATAIGALQLPGVDLDRAQRLLQSAEAEVRSGHLGYVLLTASSGDLVKT